MIRVLLDGEDITASLNKQHPLPDVASTGVWPSGNSGDWYDLLQCISENKSLAASYFNGGPNGVHVMEIIDESGMAFQARVLLRSKYTARNR